MSCGLSSARVRGSPRLVLHLVCSPPQPSRASWKRCSSERKRTIRSCSAASFLSSAPSVFSPRCCQRCALPRQIQSQPFGRSKNMNDLRFAFRQFLKSPAFTIITVLTLALGIGANTAIFSVVNAVLLRPLPYPQPERIVYLNEVSSGIDQSIALPDYLDWRKDAKSFEHLALSRLESRNLSGLAGREPERISVAFVTANFFNVIALGPAIGRTFSQEEDKPGAPALVVLSDRLWDRAFNRNPNIVGQAINF